MKLTKIERKQIWRKCGVLLIFACVGLIGMILTEPGPEWYMAPNATIFLFLYFWVLLLCGFIWGKLSDLERAKHE